jgi:hypothetical protein
MMLFFYIYHHHKILTCDEMLIEICKLLSTEKIEKKHYCLINSPIDLFMFPESDFNSNSQNLIKKIKFLESKLDVDDELSSDEKKGIKVKYNLAIMLIESFANRNLFTRSLVIYPDYVDFNVHRESLKVFFDKPIFRGEINKTIVDLLIWIDKNRISLNEIRTRNSKNIIENILKCVKLLSKYTSIDSFFFIIAPKPPTGNEASELIYIKLPSRKKIKYIFPLDHWIKAYVHHRWAIYIVSKEEFRTLINIIIRYLLYKKKLWKIDRLSAINSHLDVTSINKLNRLFLTLSTKFHDFPLEKDILEKIYY